MNYQLVFTIIKRIFILLTVFCCLSLLSIFISINSTHIFANSSWNIVSSPNLETKNNILNGISAVSANDIWAVGYYYPSATGGSQSLIQHWDGMHLSIIPSPNVGMGHNELRGISATSANDVWAVGIYLTDNYGFNNKSQTLIQHWDGNNWTIIPSPNLGTGENFLDQVSGTSANDVWAVGTVDAGIIDGIQTANTLIMHWNGNSWGIVSSPNTHTTNINRLHGVTAISTNDVWAVGSYDDHITGYTQTLIQHWDGRTWSIVPSPNNGTANYLFGTTAISADDVWAVGYYLSSDGIYQTLIEHWDGNKWSIVSNPNKRDVFAVLNGINAASTNDVWAVGYYWVNNTDGIVKTLIEHWDGKRWNIISSSNAGNNGSTLNGVAAISTSDIWTVGYFDIGNQQTLIEHYPNGISPIFPSPTSTPTISPPPSQPCTLPHFGDVSGNPLRQYDSQWADVAYGGRYYTRPDGSRVFLPFIDYGNGKDTIGTWGCKLTSAAMIINYFAKTQNVIDPTANQVFQTDPKKLNEWMQQHDGYYSGHALPAGNPTYWDTAFVDLASVVKYAHDNGVQLSYDQTLIPGTKNKIDQSMCALNPVILGVNNAGHFIDATGNVVLNGVDTWRIHDPLWNGVTPGITTLKEKYTNTFAQIDLMSGNHTKSHLTIHKYSPIEMYITDPQGRREGLDSTTNALLEEIPLASYGLEHLGADDGGNGLLEDGVLDIPDSLTGDYILTIMGTGNGEYGLETRELDDAATETSTSLYDTTTPGQTATYLIRQSSAGNQQVQMEPAQQITLDVKPDDTKNSINVKSKGVIPAAILSSQTFDATIVDPLSLRFGPNGVGTNHDRGAIQDVNHDGKPDLMLHFNTQQSGILANQSRVCLSGKTSDGQAIAGCDHVQAF